jgi:hypothetical protein
MTSLSSDQSSLNVETYGTGGSEHVSGNISTKLGSSPDQAWSIASSIASGVVVGRKISSSSERVSDSVFPLYTTSMDISSGVETVPR